MATLTVLMTRMVSLNGSTAAAEFRVSLAYSGDWQLPPYLPLNITMMFDAF
jgi:hypothetical protein